MPPDETGKDEPEKGGTPPEPKLTIPPELQEHINAIAGAARDEGRKAALSAVYAELGVKDRDELKGKLETLSTIESANKSELEKAQAELEKERKARAEEARAAKRTIVTSAIRAEAASRGLDADEVATYLDSVGATERFEVNLTDGTVKGIDTAIEGLLKLVPAAKGGNTYHRQGSGGKPDLSPVNDYLSRTYGAKAKE
jgi:outer membrane murein-binding lipoprotein Lpp